MFGDLITLTDVKAWLKIGQSDFPITDDALLTRLVSAASQYIQSWLNRQIASADYFEVRDGTGGETLQFACFPVTEVAAVTIDGQSFHARPRLWRRATHSVPLSYPCEVTGLVAAFRISPFPTRRDMRPFHQILLRPASNSSLCAIASVAVSANCQGPSGALRR